MKKYQVKSFSFKDRDKLEVLDQELENWLNSIKKPIKQYQVNSLNFQPLNQLHGTGIIMQAIVEFKEGKKGD